MGNSDRMNDALADLADTMAALIRVLPQDHPDPEERKGTA